MLTGLRTAHIFTVPGEHDSIDDAGQKYRSVFGAGTRGDGWYSFDIAGVRQRIGRRGSAIERDIAFGLGKHLVDMAVEAGQRREDSDLPFGPSK